MDPISYVFAAYLNAVQTTTYNVMSERFGTEVKAVVIEYEGTAIPYQFQVWRIKHKSVCANVGQNVAQYSLCTVKAVKLFSSLCSELEAGKTKNMYCDAAFTYKPTIASIRSGTQITPLDEARSGCNTATIEAMADNTKSSDQKRKLACDAYRVMKSGS